MAEETTQTTEVEAPETEVKAVEKTPEQKAKTKETLDRFFKQSARKTPEVERPGKKKEEAKTEAKDEPKDEKKSEVKTDAKEEAKKTTEKAEVKTEKKVEAKKPLKPLPKTEKVEKKPEVDIEKLVQSTIKATAKEFKAPEKEENKYADLPASRISEINAVARAEKEGATHKGATDQAAERFRAEQRYIASWQEKHPGEHFDARSDEHDDWYNKNMPQWIEDATERGNRFSERDDIAKKLREDIEKDAVAPLKKQLEELRNREVEREVMMKVPNQVQQGIAAALEAINPDFLKEGAQSVEQSDPLAHRIMLRESQNIIAETHAAMLFMATRGGSLAANDPMREKLISTATELEEAIKGTEKEDQIDPSGRSFVPLDEWAVMTEAQQKKHWTITGELVAMKLAAERAAQIKQAYDEELSLITGMAKAKGWNAASDATKTEKNGTHKEEETEEEVEPEEEKGRSPSTASRTVLKPGGETKAKVPSKGRDMLFRNFARP